SIVSLGLMQVLLGKVARVGYFRPIIEDSGEGGVDNHINTMISHFKLDLKPVEAFAFTRKEVVHKKNEGKKDEIIRRIIEKYKTLEDRFDFILVEGTSFSGEGSLIEWDINVLIAKNLGIPAIIIESGVGKTLDQLVGNLMMAHDSFKDKNVEVLSIVANKVQPENVDLVINGLQQNLPSRVLVYAIPINPILANPSIKEIVEELDGKVLFGESN